MANARRTAEGSADAAPALRNGQYVLPFYDEVRKPRKKWERRQPLTDAELFHMDYPHARIVKPRKTGGGKKGGANLEAAHVAPQGRKKSGTASNKPEASATIIGVVERMLKRKAEAMLESFEMTLGAEEYHEAELAVRPGGKTSAQSITASAKRLQQLSGMAIGDAIKHPGESALSQFDDDPESAHFGSKRSRAGEGRTLASEVAYLSKMHSFAANGDFAGLVGYCENDLAAKVNQGVNAARRILEDPLIAAAIGMARQRMKNKN